MKRKNTRKLFILKNLYFSIKKKQTITNLMMFFFQILKHFYKTVSVEYNIR